MAYSGTYKGIRFRSILELSVIRHFESEGLTLSKDFTYESTTVKYGKTRIRDYVIDLTFPEHKLLVEVKPLSRVDNKRNKSKREGAEKWCAENGWEYVIVTDAELRDCGELLTLEQASLIPDVVLNERAKRALKRKQARVARKKRKK